MPSKRGSGKRTPVQSGSAKNLVAHPVGSDSPRELCQSHNSHKRNLVVLLSYCSDKQPEKSDMMSKTQLRFSEEGE